MRLLGKPGMHPAGDARSLRKPQQGVISLLCLSVSLSLCLSLSLSHTHTQTHTHTHTHGITCVNPRENVPGESWAVNQRGRCLDHTPTPTPTRQGSLELVRFLQETPHKPRPTRTHSLGGGGPSQPREAADPCWLLGTKCGRPSQASRRGGKRQPGLGAAGLLG